MSERVLDLARPESSRTAGAAACARIDKGLPPYRRQRLRGAGEARVLQRAGTPEALIGPVGSDEAVERERASLVAFARRLRANA